MKTLKPWRLIAAFLLGMVVGVPSGIYFYSTWIEKPTTVVNNQNDIKQKVKGNGNRADQDMTDNRKVDIDNHRGKRKNR
ncbi:MAG: hypothetical protein N4A74_21460 [Carboxylicivirga sp.]|jgi:hypothetical protein|nr:hypothetical protein [Carboxylicivirga sp.]